MSTRCEAVPTQWGRQHRFEGSRKDFLKAIEPRLLWHSKPVDEGTLEDQPRHVVDNAAEANCVSSLTPTGTHMPAIDVDLPVVCVPSTHKGRFHLYFDVEMPKEDYHKLLQVMADVGIVAQNFVKHATDRETGETYLRLPWKIKPKWAVDSA